MAGNETMSEANTMERVWSEGDGEGKVLLVQDNTQLHKESQRVPPTVQMEESGKFPRDTKTEDRVFRKQIYVMCFCKM